MSPEMRDGTSRKRPHATVDLPLQPGVGMNAANTTGSGINGGINGGTNGVAFPMHSQSPTTGGTLYLPRLTWPLAPPSKHQHFGEMSTISENDEHDRENTKDNEDNTDRLAGVSSHYGQTVHINDPMACITSPVTLNLHPTPSHVQNGMYGMHVEMRVLEGGEEEWEVLLLLDSREVRTQQDRSFLHNHLQLAGVSCEVRSLGLGDMQWIARRRETGQEVMLSTIVERKNTRDFAQSILDGRFDEQQYRLMNCGCKHPIYLIEGSLRSQDVLSPDKLQSDIMTTVVNRNLYVYMSTSIDDTVVFLKGVHERVKDGFHRYFAYEDE